MTTPSARVWAGEAPVGPGPGAAKPVVLSTGATVKTLVKLKIRLIGGNLRVRRSGKGRRVAFVLSVVFALAGGGLGAYLVATVAAGGGIHARAMAVVGATALLVGWTVFPIVTIGADETLDPSRLRLFPLTSRAVVAGLAVSSLVGPAPLAGVLVAGGAVAGWGGGSATLVVLPAAVLLVLSCVVTSRALLASLAAALTSRKGRDMVAFVAPLLALATQGLRLLSFDVSDGTWRAIVGVLRWGPPGMLGQAMVDAGSGRLGRGALELAPSVLLLVVGGYLWDRALERSLSEVEAHGGPAGAPLASADRPARGVLTLPVPLLRRLPARPWVASASRELRTLVRHPRARAQLLNLVIIGVGPAVYFSLTQAVTGRLTVLVAAAASPAAMLGAQNQFGIDGPAFWTDLLAGNLRATLIGKNVALAATVLPVTLVSAMVLAARSGEWASVPAVVALALAGLGAGLAVANQLSVRFPWPMPQSSNPFGNRSAGVGCLVGMVGMVGVVAESILMAPVAVAAVLAAEAGTLPLLVAGLAGAAYGALIWLLGLRLAVGYAGPRQPEMLAAVDRRAG
jgi:ABC-2 type transport system permease protein